MVKRQKALQGDGASSSPRADYIGVSGYRTPKGHRKKLHIQRRVLKKMLAPSPNGDLKEFVSTGRTGRRNALPDISDTHAQIGLLDLSDRFEELTTETDQATRSDNQDTNAPGTSKDSFYQNWDEGASSCRSCRNYNSKYTEQCVLHNSDHSPTQFQEMYENEEVKEFWIGNRCVRRNALADAFSDGFEEYTIETEAPTTPSEQDPNTPGTSKQHG